MTATGVGEKIREELHAYAALVAYLYVCFAVLLLFEATAQPGGTLQPHGFAIIKALILGKFILLGRMAGAGLRIRTETVGGRIALRIVGLMLTVILLTLAEEAIVGAVHGHSIGSTVAEIFGSPRYSVFARCAVMTLVMVPLVALEELDRALGRGVLRRALRQRPAD